MQIMVSHEQRSRLLEIAISAGVTMQAALDGLLRAAFGLERRGYTLRAPRARKTVSRPLVTVDDETIRESMFEWYMRWPEEDLRRDIERLGITRVRARHRMAKRLVDEHVQGTSSVMAARSRGDVHGATALVGEIIDNVWGDAETERDAAEARWKDMIHG